MTNNTNESGDNFITGTGFQVPSFGDEDFDLLQVPLILPSEQATSHDNNHAYNTQSQSISHQQITTIDNSQVTMASNMQQSNNVFSNIGNPSTVTPKFPPQNYYDPDINMTNTFQGSNPSFDGGNVFQSVAMTTSQGMFQGQSSQGQMVTAGQQQPLSTICHSQISNHLGFQALGVNQASPQNSNSVSPNRESTSEDSDDSLPLAQLVSLKRQAAVSSDIQHANNSPAAPSLPVNTTPTAPAAKKMKTPKRKKKKDPNEPQKPVSAYALFFRDTQAAIKGQNPSASFGEVSKIVASMWDGLDPDHKNVYKKKTEMAKKEYLKQLAAYRASQVSLAGVEEANAANEKSPPYQDSMKISPGNQLIGENSQMMTQMSSPQVINYSPPHQQTLQHFQPSQQNNNMIYQSQNQADYGGRIGMSSSVCIRNGCVNNAINNPCWDEEYCSSECVVSHCRDVFTAWVANRQASSSFPVK